MRWRGQESNQRHRDFQSRALPTELPRPRRQSTASVTSGAWHLATQRSGLRDGATAPRRPLCDIAVQHFRRYASSDRHSSIVGLELDPAAVADRGGAISSAASPRLIATDEQPLRVLVQHDLALADVGERLGAARVVAVVDRHHLGQRAGHEQTRQLRRRRPPAGCCRTGRCTAPRPRAGSRSAVARVVAAHQVGRIDRGPQRARGRRPAARCAGAPARTRRGREMCATPGAACSRGLVMLDRQHDPAARLGRRHQQAVVGADEQPAVAAAQRDRAALRADAGIDHREVHAHRQVAASRPPAAARPGRPPAARCRGRCGSPGVRADQVDHPVADADEVVGQAEVRQERDERLGSLALMTLLRRAAAARPRPGPPRRAGRPRSPARRPRSRSVSLVTGPIETARSRARSAGVQRRPARSSTVDDDVNVTRSARITASASTGSRTRAVERDLVDLGARAPRRPVGRARARALGRRDQHPPAGDVAQRLEQPLLDGLLRHDVGLDPARAERRRRWRGRPPRRARPRSAARRRPAAARPRWRWSGRRCRSAPGRAARTASGSIRIAGASTTAAPSSVSRAARPLACARARVTATGGRTAAAARTRPSARAARRPRPPA